MHSRRCACCSSARAWLRACSGVLKACSWVCWPRIKAAAEISLGALLAWAGLCTVKRPGDSNSMAGSSGAAGSSVLSGGASWLFIGLSVAVAHHVDMGDAGVKKLAADHGKAKTLIERAGMHLGAEHL